MMLLWMMVLATSLIIQGVYAESCIEEERLALLELKSYMKAYVDPKFHEFQSDFGVGDRYNCCDGSQVRCNPATGRVTGLNLMTVAYTNDTRRSWLFNVTLFKPFKELVRLDLWLNAISGLVEADGSRKISSLKNLQYLTLADNNFNGDIFGLCDLKNLKELDLRRNNFSGGVPSCLQNFSSLQHLDFSGNNFEGKLSLSSLANISELQVLDLSRNRLEVETEDSSWQPAFQLQYLGLAGCSLNHKLGRAIPKFLTHQYNLSAIDLSDNGLVGSFPSWLFNNNSMLNAIVLRNNSLTGRFELPDNYTFWNFEALDISNNDVEGMIHEDVGFVFPGLQFLNVSGNHFEGHVPNSIVNMQGLYTLDLSYNNLSGELPKQLLSDCAWLDLLILSNNRLQGDIIPAGMNLTRLSFLMLSNNHFGGTIKNALLNSPDLLHLDLSNNKVTGPLPNWIYGLSKLDTLSISNNNLQGEIPAELCRLHKLKYLDLSKNNFMGPVPSCSNFSSLSYMHLQSNSLTGPIPNRLLLSARNLITLDMRDNQLSGNIPSWINKLSRLQVLLLGGNNFDGKIPPELCQLRDIDILDLSRNRLCGRLLPCFANMSFGVTRIDLYEGSQVMNVAYAPTLLHPGASLVYVIAPEEVGVLVKNQYLIYKGGILQIMSALDLSSNRLSGVIPQELGDLSHVHSLNLSHNNLSGSIPSSFSNLNQIESLDLSDNNLSGVIPYQLVDLNFLSIFNVSYNNLTGRAPETGQFASFDQRNYLGNPRLCGSTINKSCNPVPPPVPPTGTGATKEDGNAAFDIEDFLWSFGMTSFVAFVATLAVLGINPRWRKALFDFMEWHLLWWLL